MNRNVLVISNNSFSKTTNNGKTLESIFSGFNKNNISQLYFTGKVDPDFDFCDNYYRILDIDVLRGLFSHKNNVGGIQEKHIQLKDVNGSFTMSKVTSTFNSKQSFFRFFRDILWATNSWKTNVLHEWCLTYNPDIIFFVAGGGKFSHNIADYLSGLLKVPLISFFTDDYLIYPKKRNLFDFIQRYRMGKFYRATVKKSSLCFAIGNIMCETYSTYFGKIFLPIMNSVPVRPLVKQFKKNDKIVINYFGSIHTRRWEMIIRLGNILKLVNRNDITVNVYTTNKPDIKILKLFYNAGINYKGGVFGNDLQNSILESDILLHVESDDIYSKSMTRLSISTKIPEYLMSGRPILAFGPKDVASMKLLTENNIGIVISSSDDSYIIDNQLKKLLNDSSYRENLGKFAYDYAINNFDNKKIVQDFNMNIDQILILK